MIRTIDAKTGLETQRSLTPEEVTKLESQSKNFLNNRRIKNLQLELSIIDQKRIRPIAEGDTEYLLTLNAQAIALREELRGLNA